MILSFFSNFLTQKYRDKAKRNDNNNDNDIIMIIIIVIKKERKKERKKEGKRLCIGFVGRKLT